MSNLMSNQIVIDIRAPTIAAGIRATVSAESATNPRVVSEIAKRLTRELNAWAGGPPKGETKTPGLRAAYVPNMWGAAIPYGIYTRTLGGPGGRRTGRTTRMLHKVLATDPKGAGNRRVTVVTPTYEHATRLADRIMELDTDGVLFRSGPTTVYRGDQRIAFISEEGAHHYLKGTNALVYWDHAVQGEVFG